MVVMVGRTAFRFRLYFIFFVVKINGRDAGKFSERHLFVETDQFVAGMFHTLACVVQDADGVSLASDNSTFIVRSGCGHRRGW